jgi:SRSO17 transposase
MPRIGRFPPFGKRFFRRARKLIGSCQFAHFWRVVLALAGMNGRRSLNRMQGLFRNRRTRQAISYFITKAQWNAPEVLRQTALDTLKALGWHPGQTVYIAIDDTQKRKRAKQMDAVSKIFLHAEKIYATGHTIVGCTLIYRGVVIPYAVRLWACEEYCAGPQKLSPGEEPVKFRKLTELAADCVLDVSLPVPAKGIVLFDSYYLIFVRWLSASAKRRSFATSAWPRKTATSSRRDAIATNAAWAVTGPTCSNAGVG